MLLCGQMGPQKHFATTVHFTTTVPVSSSIVPICQHMSVSVRGGDYLFNMCPKQSHKFYASFQNVVRRAFGIVTHIESLLTLSSFSDCLSSIGESQCLFHNVIMVV